MKNKIIVLGLTFLVAITNVNAERPLRKIVVSPSKTSSSTDKVASAVSVITKEDIEASNRTQVLDLLKMVPSLDVVQGGGAGGQASVFIRGANSEHTLVLLDGVELNNPVSTARAFNFANLTLDNIENIEVLRGAQSIYGSDALGGVISIFTKKVKENKASASFEAGSFDAFRERFNLSGYHNDLSFNLGVVREDIRSFSAVRDSNRTNAEADPYKNTSVTANANYVLNDNIELLAMFRNQDSSANIDNNGISGGDDPNRLFKNRSTIYKFETKLTSLDGSLVNKVGYNFSDHTYSDNNSTDFYNMLDILNSDYNSSLDKFYLNGEFKYSNNAKLVYGIETEKEKADSNFFSDGLFGPFTSTFPNREQRTSGGYLEFLHTINDHISYTVGGRYDRNSNFGETFNYRFAPVISIDNDTRIKAVYGTGFKAPSLFQLFSSFGSQTLNAEESRSFDVAFERVLNDNTIFEVRYFKNKIDNLIDFDPNTFLFSNINSADFEGFEGVLNLLYDDLFIKLYYTYTDTHNNSNQQSLLRRARNKAGLNVNYKYSSKLNFGSELQFVGRRFDNNFNTFPAQREALGSYFLLNLLSTYSICKNVDLRFRVENLLDRNYENVLGFNTPRRSFFVGINVKI